MLLRWLVCVLASIASPCNAFFVPGSMLSQRMPAVARHQSNVISMQATPSTQYDSASLAVLPVTAGLTAGAFVAPALCKTLAVLMLARMLIDSLWVATKPQMVPSVIALLRHHLLTAVLLIHALTYPAHLLFVPGVTLFELNTLLLVFRRKNPYLGWASAPLGPLFAIAWVGIRVCWLPILAVRLALAPGWASGTQGLVRRVLVSVCAMCLALAPAVGPVPGDPAESALPAPAEMATVYTEEDWAAQQEDEAA